MSKFLKILLVLILIIITIVAVAILISSFLIGGLLNPPINRKKAEKVLLNDYSVISTIIDYMENSEYVNISIQSNDYVYDDGNYGTWYIYDETSKNQDMGTQKIKDNNIVNILDVLFKGKKYKNIIKNGNTISFLLWSNLDEGRGIAYTLDGGAPMLQFLTKYEKINKKNWYYYEENFNEWKLKNER